MSYRYDPTENNSESISEHLTIQALKDHDNGLSSGRGQGPWSLDSKTSDSVRSKQASESSRRLFTNKVVDSQASKKPSRIEERPRSIVNLFKLVFITKAWHKQARNSSKMRKEIMKYIEFENTYKLEPDPGRYFDVSGVSAILKYNLEQKLRYTNYSPKRCGLLTIELTENIKRDVKLISSPRYKILCLVLIFEYKKQGLQYSSRGLWNVDTDNYASFTYKNRSLVAVANVYGLYYE